MNARLAEIQAREAVATPGPWAWRGSVDNHNLHLRGLRSPRPNVLSFHRHGMRGAQPVFTVDHLLVDGKHLAVYEVCREATSRDDPRVYRGDVVGFRHPDAEFIAHSRSDVAYLLERVLGLEAAIAGIYEI